MMVFSRCGRWAILLLIVFCCTALPALAAETAASDDGWPGWVRSLVKSKDSSITTGEVVMFCIGMVGQIFFTSRFVVQWIASERRKESYVPVAFWYLSILGSGMLLAYAISIWAVPIVLGQMFGVVVYSRNLVLIARQSNAAKEKQQPDDFAEGAREVSPPVRCPNWRRQND